MPSFLLVRLLLLGNYYKNQSQKEENIDLTIKQAVRDMMVAFKEGLIKKIYYICTVLLLSLFFQRFPLALQLL